MKAENKVFSVLSAFWLGVREATTDWTTHVEGHGEDAYEYGRRLTRWALRW